MQLQGWDFTAGLLGLAAVHCYLSDLLVKDMLLLPAD